MHSSSNLVRSTKIEVFDAVETKFRIWIAIGFIAKQNMIVVSLVIHATGDGDPPKRKQLQAGRYFGATTDINSTISYDPILESSPASGFERARARSSLT